MHGHLVGCFLLPTQTLAEAGAVAVVAEAEGLLPPQLPTAACAPNNLQESLHVIICDQLHHLCLEFINVGLAVSFLTKSVDETHVRDCLLITLDKVSYVVGNQLTNIYRAPLQNGSNSVHSNQRNLR